MDRSALWPDVRDAWILYEDEWLIAIAKPVGIPSHAPDPKRADDVIARLKAYLGRREGRAARDVYLGVHHRLDRETSGVLLFAKRREANPGLAAQFEGRSIEKTYLAAVRGWPAGVTEKTLRDRLAPGEGSKTRVLRAGERGGVHAVSHVRLLRRKDDRALLAVRIETGRTHQIRAQLAAAGCPVAGDVLYGGDRAPRLLLHASALRLAHPLTNASLTLEAPPPPELEAWLAGADGVNLDDPPMLTAALQRAAERRYALAHSSDTDAFRLLNAGGDGVPGLAVDAYGAFLVAHLYGDEADAARETLLDVLAALPFEGVYLKRHPRQANVLVDSRREDLAPSAPVRGRAAPATFVVHEEGLPFHVALGDGLSTSLFLDQRENRRRIRELAKGADVLNLFAYTCAFTVAAAAGGARRTVSVDASSIALERGRANLTFAGFGGDDHHLEREDAFVYLEGAARSKRRFDLVIVDPPTYSTTSATRWASGKDWRRLAASCLRVLSPGGRLLACTNDRRLSIGRFRKLLHEGARHARRSVRRMRDVPPPIDFPPEFGEEPHLKSVWVEVG